MPDIPANSTTTERLFINEGYLTEIETAGDVDWFRTEFAASQIYSYQIQGEGSRADGGAVPRLVGLYDAEGVLIDGTANRNDEEAGTLLGGFPLQEAGTYFLAVADTDSTASGGSMVVGLTAAAAVPSDDYSADTDTTGRVTVGGSVLGNLEEPDDTDWLAVDLEAGQTYIIDYEGRPTDAGTLADPYLINVLGPDGATALPGGRNDDSGSLNSRGVVSPTETGTHYIVAQSYAQGYAGSYTISVTQLMDDFLGNTDTAGRVDPGTSTVGRIDIQGDRDWFASDLLAGQAYRITVEDAPGSNAYSSLWGRVYDPQGIQVSSVDWEGYDPRTGFFTPTADGTYFIEASGSNIWDYSLSVEARVQVVGTNGDDWLTLPMQAHVDLAFVEGANGTDMFSFATAAQGVTVNLETDIANHQGRILPLHSIENVTGSSFDDTIFGSDRAELMRGLGGADTFVGSDGGRDAYHGGSGRDTVSYVNARAGVEASLLRERGGSGWAEDDILRSIENLTGSAFDDMLTGDHERNFLFGAGGDDTIMGNGGDDYILAGFGTDTIIFSGNQAEYTVTQDGIATTVAHIGGTMLDGTDLIGHAEILRFADGDVIL